MQIDVNVYEINRNFSTSIQFYMEHTKDKTFWVSCVLVNLDGMYTTARKFWSLQPFFIQNIYCNQFVYCLISCGDSEWHTFYVFIHHNWYVERRASIYSLKYMHWSKFNKWIMKLNKWTRTSVWCRMCLRKLCRYSHNDVRTHIFFILFLLY